RFRDDGILSVFADQQDAAARGAEGMDDLGERRVRCLARHPAAREGRRQVARCRRVATGLVGLDAFGPVVRRAHICVTHERQTYEAGCHGQERDRMHENCPTEGKIDATAESAAGAAIVKVEVVTGSRSYLISIKRSRRPPTGWCPVCGTRTPL